MGFAKGKRDWRRTALAMALALACFFATWAVFGLRYELNDDAQLANIAMGAYGEDTHHLVYVNVLLGWFLKPFYALAANVNWYYFLQVAANVAAFGMLGTLCMERLGTRRGLLLYGGVLLAFGVDMFNSFQYTKNSALYLTVGLALLASELGVWSLRVGAVRIFHIAVGRGDTGNVRAVVALLIVVMRDVESGVNIVEAEGDLAADIQSIAGQALIALYGMQLRQTRLRVLKLSRPQHRQTSC